MGNLPESHLRDPRPCPVRQVAELEGTLVERQVRLGKAGNARPGQHPATGGDHQRLDATNDREVYGLHSSCSHSLCR